eukprot:TRINITY_DN96242_c0_g1_i1.p1 TRINITY_DN96242_c0_g1~~TRINITY_DN96242_c0_g1_i1.p1  ORF type:complete len:111 (+),score=21.63 TRINITY_DN96242_c0_g1_i1:181-513(+)
MSFLFGAQKSPQDVRDEQYVSQMVTLDKILSSLAEKKTSKTEALAHADHCMENILAIGTVDGENATKLLQQAGLDDARRLSLQQAYQDLKKACGQSVPDYGKKKKKSCCC